MFKHNSNALLDEILESEGELGITQESSQCWRHLMLVLLDCAWKASIKVACRFSMELGAFRILMYGTTFYAGSALDLTEFFL